MSESPWLFQTNYTVISATFNKKGGELKTPEHYFAKQNIDMKHACCGTSN